MTKEIEVSSFPKCELCTKNKDAHYDARTVSGYWAFMCDDCFRSYGISLGCGEGQKLVLKE